MISILITWMIATFVAYGIGILFNYLFVGKEKALFWSWDLIIIVGICLLTVYAQLFSIFHRVGSLAFVLVLMVAIGSIFLLKDGIIIPKKLNNKQKVIIGLATIIVILTAIYTNSIGGSGDSYSYHIQAIYWINKYGIVPGLGNFHNRFAYNSSALSLHALFSFQWLTGKQLHTINGLLVAIILIYVTSSNSIVNKRPLGLSDVMKVVSLAYIFSTRENIGLPMTDTLPLLLSIYVLCKWAECIENSDILHSEYIYSVLGLIGVFGITAKLSAAFLSLLMIYPLVECIRNRYYKLLAMNIVCSIGIVIPWVIRSVLISGYLVYPMAEIDIFNVDWKMPRSVLLYDKYEISAWAKKTFDVKLRDLSFIDWFSQYWWTGSNNMDRIWMVIAFLCLIGVSIYVLINYKRLQKAFLILLMTIIVSFIYWLLEAPLMRYGSVWILLLLSVGIYILSQIFKSKWICDVYILFFILYYGLGLIINIPHVSWNFLQNDYVYYKTRLVELDGFEAYTIDDIEGGNDVFPYVPFDRMLERIELRGADLSSGFKIKDEYQGLELMNSGYIWEHE